MYLPALEDKLKREREQQKQQENRLYLPDLQAEYEEYIRRKQSEEQKPTETVITIQIA